MLRFGPANSFAPISCPERFLLAAYFRGAAVQYLPSLSEFGLIVLIQSMYGTVSTILTLLMTVTPRFFGTGAVGKASKSIFTGKGLLELKLLSTNSHNQYRVWVCRGRRGHKVGPGPRHWH